MLYPNIITSDLEGELDKIAGEENMVVILSSLTEILHGYYSKEKSESPTTIPYIRYNNEEISAPSIAEIMGGKYYPYELGKMGLTPFSFFSSFDTNGQGLDYRLLIAGDIKWDKVKEITKLLENDRKEHTGYSMNLRLETKAGK